MDVDNDNDAHLMNEQQKIRIALQTIIGGKLKPNHDETLLEKFCSLLAEFDSKHLEQIIVEETLFELIDNRLSHLVIDESNKQHNYEYLVPFIDELIILFRIGKSLLVHENVFKVYLDTKQQKLLKWFWKIFLQDPIYSLEKKNLLRFSLFSFLNDICKHETGKRYLLNHMIFNSDFLFIEKIFDYYDPKDNTHYVQNEIDLLLANIIAILTNYQNDQPKNCDKQIEIILKKIIQNLTNQSRILLKILDVISNPKEFVQSFKITELIATGWSETVNQMQFDLSTLNDWGRLCQTLQEYLQPNHKTLEPVIKLIQKKLLKQNDCFLYSTFLYRIINFEQSYQAKFIHFLQNYLNLMKKHYGYLDHNLGSSSEGQLSPEEQLIIQNTFSRVPFGHFQTQTFIQLKVDLLTLESKSMIINQLPPDFISCINFNNRKDFNLLVTFLEQMLISTTNNSDQELLISSIYLKLYSKFLSYRKCVLRSICDITKQKRCFYFEEILPQLRQHMHKYLPESEQEELDNQDEMDILELIVELIYIIVMSKCLINDEINEFLRLEYELLKTKEHCAMIVEDSCRVNMICTMFLVHYCEPNKQHFNTPFLNDQFFDIVLNLDQEHLDFRQQFCSNMIDLFQQVPTPRFAFDQYKRLMKLCCHNCWNEFDIELQLILFNLIELILDQETSERKIAELIHDSGYIQMIYHLIRQETFLSWQVKKIAIQSFWKFFNKIESIQQQQSNEKFGISFLEAFEYLSKNLPLSSESPTNQDDLHQTNSLSNPLMANYSSLLDDIINTSTMINAKDNNNEMFKEMDCY